MKKYLNIIVLENSQDKLQYVMKNRVYNLEKSTWLSCDF